MTDELEGDIFVKQKKTIKQLMSLGIRRNEAAGFVATYNKLSAKQRLQYLPNVVFDMRPAPPLLREDKKIVSFAVRQVIPTEDPFAGHLPQEVREGMVKKRMVDEMSKALMHSGAVSIEKRQYDTYGGVTEIIARIRVVEP